MDHVNERELAEALRRAIHVAIEEVAPFGGERAISADTYADCLSPCFSQPVRSRKHPTSWSGSLSCSAPSLSQRWRGAALLGARKAGSRHLAGPNALDVDRREFDATERS